MRHHPPMWLLVAAVAGLAACDVTVDGDSATPPQPAAQPVTVAPQPAVPQPAAPSPAPPKPTPALLTPKPTAQPGAAQPAPSGPTRVDVGTPAGVDDACYRRCLQQNMMRAVPAAEIAKTCQASCPAK